MESEEGREGQQGVFRRMEEVAERIRKISMKSNEEKEEEEGKGRGR